MSGGVETLSNEDLMRQLSQARSAPVSRAQTQSADVSSLSNDALMAALGEARAGAGGEDPGALHIHVGAKPSWIDERAGQGPTSSAEAAPRVRSPEMYDAPNSSSQSIGNNQAAADALFGGLRAKADERLVGKADASSPWLTGAIRMGNTALLNTPRYAAGAVKTLRDGGGFLENVDRLRDEDEALSRQNPKSAIAGTGAGVVAGAATLPMLGGATAVTLPGRAGQAGLTGGIYGAAGEALDSRDLTRAAGAFGVGAALGGAGSAAIEVAAPHVMAAANRAWPALSRAIGRGVPVVTEQGRFTPEAEAALREIGLDPAHLPDELAGLFTRAFRDKGVSPAIAREAQAAEFGVPLSRGQATQDAPTLGRESAAIGGLSGGKAQDLGQAFVGQQSAALDAARFRLQGVAARDGALIENPAVAAEAISDRARQAAGDHALDVAAAQRAEEDARRLARGQGGDALDAAASVGAGVREAAGRSREAYRGGYRGVGRVEGEFRPGAFDRMGERVRAALGQDLPIDPVVTPAASRAIADLDNLPTLLAKPDGAGATSADIETIRRRLLAYRKTTGGNPTDREAVDAITRRFDEHIEGAEAAGLFGPRPAAPAARASGDDFPGFAPAGIPEPRALPAPRSAEPESFVRYVARHGGLPLDAEARAADLHRTYEPGAGTLARGNGRSYDDWRTKLVEDGWLPYQTGHEISSADVADRMREMIARERIQGQRAVRVGDETRGPVGREVGRAADENAGHAVDVDREARKLAIDLEGFGITGAGLDRAALRQAAEARVLGHADDGIAAYEQAVSRGPAGSSTASQAVPDVPFPDLGEGTAVAASDALPGGSTSLTTAMRNARGLFRQHQQNFKPRGPGDDAGRLMQKLVEQDATPAEIANAIFGSSSRPGEAGLSVRFANRLREAIGADSPEFAAIRQGLIARVIDGNGTGDAARRVDGLLRGNGRATAAAILTEDQRRGLGAWRAAVAQLEHRRQALPDWIGDLAKNDFDPNAVASGLFGSGVPGERIGSANFARGLKGFLGEESGEWSSLRQAAVINLTKPGGRALSPAQEADRVVEFVRGKGAGLAGQLFTAAERSQLSRYATVVRSTALPNGIAAPDAGGTRATAAHLLNGLLGAVAAKVAVPYAASVPFTAQIGQRMLLSGPGAFNASRSFRGGAPRVKPEGPVLDLRRVGAGTGLATEYALP